MIKTRHSVIFTSHFKQAMEEGAWIEVECVQTPERGGNTHRGGWTIFVCADDGSGGVHRSVYVTNRDLKPRVFKTAARLMSFCMELGVEEVRAKIPMLTSYEKRAARKVTSALLKRGMLTHAQYLALRMSDPEEPVKLRTDAVWIALTGGLGRHRTRSERLCRRGIYFGMEPLAISTMVGMAPNLCYLKDQFIDVQALLDQWWTRRLNPAFR